MILGDLGVAPFVAAAAQIIPGLIQSSAGGQDVVSRFQAGLIAEEEAAGRRTMLYVAGGAAALITIGAIVYAVKSRRKAA